MIQIKRFIIGLAALIAFTLGFVPSIANAALSTNLVSYWKLDESSGDAADSQGGNTLTNHGTATYAAAVINNGVSFSSASTQYLSGPTGGGLDFAGAFTISAWFKPTSTAGGGKGIWSKRRSGGNNGGYTLLYNNTASKLEFILNGIASGGIDITSTDTFATGSFYHVVIVVQSDGSSKMWVNGASEGTAGALSSYQESTVAFLIGAGQANPTFMDDGMVDEVGAWSRAITDAEVACLYNSGAGLAFASLDTCGVAASSPAPGIFNIFE